MSDFVFRMSPNVILGSYTTSRLAQLVREWGTRYLVIMDPILQEVNLAEKIIQNLNERKIENFTFSDFGDGCSTKTLQRALTLAKEGHIHGIICVGGLKAMNIGRMVSALFNEVHDMYNFIDGAVPNTAALPCICVPTTFRSPFVFTSECPIIDSRSNQLKLVHVQNNIVKLVLEDPNMMLTLTDNQRASMMLEVLCQAVEAYISQKENFFSDMFVEKAVELLGYAMDGATSLEITTPQEILLAQGGIMTSIANGASALGVASLLSMTISARYKISKSLIATILFPYIIEDAIQFKAERLAKLARIMKFATEEMDNEDAARALADNVRQRIAQANLPARLKDLQLTVDQLALACEDAGQIEIVNKLPRSMTADDLFDLVKLAF